MKNRLERLREKLTAENIDGLLITAPENRLYISGFTGTAAIIFITTKDAYLITDFRYSEQAMAQSSLFNIVEQGTTVEKTLADLVKKSGVKKIGLEKDHVTCSQYEFYKENLDFIQLLLIKSPIEELRMIKDDKEIKCLTKAVQIADAAFAHTLDMLKPNITEWEVALELEFYMRRHGAQKTAFDFIVASGERSSMPHGVASTKKLKLGELVTMDFGCVYEGYHSDITRTVVLGEADDRQRDIYNIVLQAQLAAIEAIKPGIKCCEIDKVARDIIVGRGYGDNFGHGLGHSVGLAIHEKPAFSTKDQTLLEKGMTITVEPGIYLPGWGGVRIEDIVLLTDTGCKILTGADKNLLQINT